MCLIPYPSITQGGNTLKLLVFGSLNIDHTYQVHHLVREGETIPSSGYTKNVGGKGFNQAAALAKAGLPVHFAGAIGPDGTFLTDYMRRLNIDTSNIQILDVPTGHAIIQVSETGSNSIILYGGANQSVTQEQADRVLSQFGEGDYILLQNEISLGAEILRKAHAKGLRIILNPSPISPDLLAWPLNLVDWLILNEIEGADLSGKHDPDEIITALMDQFHIPHIVLTLGEKGAVYACASSRIYQEAIAADVVDTTAAGDTFTGYFLASMLGGEAPEKALHRAAAAASLAISRPGAAESIPWAKDVIIP